MTTIVDLKRWAEMAGQREFAAYLARLAAETPADRLAECERAAGLATCNPAAEESK